MMVEIESFYAHLSIIVAVGIVTVLVLRRLQTPQDAFWDSTPWVGKRKEWFANMRASLRSIKSMQIMAEEGYNKACEAHTKEESNTILTANVVLQGEQALYSTQFRSRRDGDAPSIANTQ